jgi:hypothetical protein
MRQHVDDHDEHLPGPPLVEAAAGSPTEPAAALGAEAVPASSAPDPVGEASVSVAAEGEPVLVQVGPIPQGTALQVPRSGGSPLARALAAANAAARNDSLGRLADWLPGYDAAASAQNVDDRRFSILEIGTSLLVHLQGVATVDRLMAEHAHHWGPAGVSFSHGDIDGHRGPPSLVAHPRGADDRGWVQVGPLANALSRGWSAILNGVDRFDPAIEAVSADLSRVTAARVNTNIYVSYGETAEGFGAHWDTHDTIIVPVAGAKHWTLFEPRVLSAQKPWIDRTTSGRPIWEGIIEPGTVLVIPRGWGHEVRGVDELSIHYTIGLNRLEVHQLVERITWEGGFWPALRADVPFDLDDPAVSYSGSVFDDDMGLAAALADVATPELVARAVASYRARCSRFPFASLQDSVAAVVRDEWDGFELELAAPVGVMVSNETEASVTLAFGDRLVVLHPAAVPVVVALAAAPQPRSALEPVIVDGVDLTGVLLRQLVAGGLAIVRRQGD